MLISWRTVFYLFMTGAFFSAILLGYVEVNVRRPLDRESGRVKELVVAEGIGLTAIAEVLEQEGIISHPLLFVYEVWKEGKSRSLQAGTYALSPSMNIKEIAAAISGGDVQKSVARVTLPEGLRIEAVEKRLRQSGIAIEEGEFTAAAGIRASLAREVYKNEFIKNIPAGGNLEGYLFPETYDFKRDAGLHDIIQKMLDEFEERVVSLYEKEKTKTNLSLHEAVTLASLVEKEARTSEDMKRVSGVLYNRLLIGMPLQVDATLMYIMGKTGPELTDSDKTVASPYNTYQNRGLPQGPIASPGLRAVQAALNPEQNDYLYYLSAQDGTTFFSKTLDEHNEKKLRYLH